MSMHALIDHVSGTQGGTFRLGGETEVKRLGFGANRITGSNFWGPPADPDEARRVLRRAVSLGINLIDTADVYGPYVSEELIAEALHPYPRDLVIATKGGLVRGAPDEWGANGRPEHLRRACEGSLRRLKLDCLDLYYLHRIDPDVPEEDQFGTLAELRREGKIRHVGLSEVDVDTIERARRIVPIAAVQNQYNLLNRMWDAVVDYCEREDIAFVPWIPLAAGPLAQTDSVAAEIARHLRATPAQVALAWLLKRSRTILPIPGTSKLRHLDDNTGALGVRLNMEEFDRMAATR